MGRFEPRSGAIERLRVSAMVREGLDDLAEIGAAGATRRAPVDTGELRESIHAERTERGSRYGTDVEYGIYQEVGTFKMAAQPYLRPALDDVKAALR